ncbi:hypothetical protein D8S78_17645 [Natrialba swarupiae]|nr:hypothetical protein [Natrialba swarupiae]
MSITKSRSRVEGSRGYERETQGTKWGTARPGWARSWLTVVIVAAVVVGLTVASAGAIAGSGEAKQGQYDELLVTDHCDEETNHLSVENPNGEPVELMLSWSTDQQSIQLQSSESLDTEIQSETTATASDDSDSQTTAYSLSTTVPSRERNVRRTRRRNVRTLCDRRWRGRPTRAHRNHSRVWLRRRRNHLRLDERSTRRTRRGRDGRRHRFGDRDNRRRPRRRRSRR